MLYILYVLHVDNSIHNLTILRILYLNINRNKFCQNVIGFISKRKLKFLFCLKHFDAHLIISSTYNF